MGFRTEYDQPLEHHFEGTDFWVKYRSGVTGRQRDFLREHYQRMVPVEAEPGTYRMEAIDPFKSRLEEMLMAIHSWNFTGDDDQPLPYGHDPFEEMKSGIPTPLRVSWGEVPAAAQDELFAAYAAASRKIVDRDANARFPADGEGGDHDGPDPTSDDREVLVGGGLPPEARSDD
jgi:hypothetical protein